MFDSNRGTRVNITADNPLGPQFQFWNDRKGKKFKTKSEMAQQKVIAVAAELQSKYFSANQETTRRVAAELRTILSSVETSCQLHENGDVSESGWGGCGCGQHYGSITFMFYDLEIGGLEGQFRA